MQRSGDDIESRSRIADGEANGGETADGGELADGESWRTWDDERGLPGSVSFPSVNGKEEDVKRREVKRQERTWVEVTCYGMDSDASRPERTIVPSSPVQSRLLDGRKSESSDNTLIFPLKSAQPVSRV